MCQALEGQPERPAPSRGTQDKKARRSGVGEQYAQGGALGDDTMHGYAGIRAFRLVQCILEQGCCLLLLFMRRAPDEQWMCLGPVRGTVPGAYDVQRAAPGLGLSEGEMDRRDAARGAAHAHHDRAITRQVPQGVAYDDHWAGGAHHQGTADRARQRTGDRSSAPAACHHGGGASGLPQKGSLGVLGNDLACDVHTRVAPPDPVGGVVENLLDEPVLESGLCGLGGGGGPLVALPQGGVHEAQGQAVQGRLVRGPVDRAQAAV
ncbi:hypothetical protein ADL02_03060 [Streptomyces sp. NRRL WC-3723]|nr:hypothetical protein ADL02_03060 [Streptomyces sp. NRRL WC-3723]